MIWVGNSIWSHPLQISPCEGVVRYRILASDRAGNDDNIVNGADVATVLAYWGSSYRCADSNNDGVVSGPDLATVLANYGSAG